MKSKYAFKSLLLGLGSVAVVTVPVVAAVSCTGSTPSIDSSTGVDLTKASAGTWHTLFHQNGRSLPAVGTKLQVTAGGKTLGFAWTEADTNAATPQAYINKTADQPQMLAYLATRFSQGGISAQDAYSAFSVTNHQAGTMPSGDFTQGMPTGGVSEVVGGGGTVSPEDDGVMLLSRDSWHELFHANGGTSRTLPEAGTEIILPLDSKQGQRGPVADPDGQTVSITWTQRDTNSQTAQGYLSGTKTQSDIVKYIQQKFIIENSMYEVKIKEAIKLVTGGHTVLDDLGYVTDRAAITTFDLQNGTASGELNVAQKTGNVPNISGVWHAAFAYTGSSVGSSHNGRSLPFEGDVFKWGSNTYTWKIVDSENLAGWLTNEINQNQVVLYVAGKVAGTNVQIRDQIILSVETDGHHLATGGESPAEYAGITGLTYNLTSSSDNAEIWHGLSKNSMTGGGNLVVGTTLKVVVAGDTLSHSITEQELSHADSIATAKEFEEYIAELLSNGTSHTKEEVITAMGFNAQSHTGSGTPHSGTNTP